MFASEDRVADLVAQARSEARRAGLGHFLILVKRNGKVIAVSDQTQIQTGDVYVGVTPDVKAG